MNKEARPFEEYKEIIKDMNKDNMIRGLYDMSKHIIELENKIDKAIEYFKYQLDNLDFYEDTKAKMLCAMGITLLQEGDKE